MSISSISDLARQHMLNILGYPSAKQSGSSTQTSSSLASTNTNSTQLSAFAQMLTELQQMEESNPGQYAKVSQQISTNLSAAASTAQTKGNTALSAQLTTLAKDFSTASQTGQLPNVGDLERAMHGASHKAAADASANLVAGGAHPNASNILAQVLNTAGL